MLFKCVAWCFQQWDDLFFIHGIVQWSTVLCDIPCRGTLCYMPQFWWSGPNIGPQKNWITWTSHWRAPWETSGWPPWFPETDLYTFPKGLVDQSAWNSDFLCSLIHNICINKKIVLQSLLVYYSSIILDFVNPWHILAYSFQTVHIFIDILFGKFRKKTIKTRYNTSWTGVSTES